MNNSLLKELCLVNGISGDENTVRDVILAEIKNYANDNYIAPIPTVCGDYYSIKHNNVGYQIGIMTGPETIYYCMRTEEEKNYIPFKDIQNNIKTPTAILINNKMEELTKLISSMIDNDISYDIILGETEKTLQKVLGK